MEFRQAVLERRMVRAFTADPVPRATTDRLIRYAERAPSAGNVGGRRYLVLESPAARKRYWDCSLPEDRRAAFGWPDLLVAPVLIIPCSVPEDYLARYAEADKHSRLGTSLSEWEVPYWYVDGGAAVMNLLLGAEDEGLGALFFGLFDRTDAVRQEFGIPSSAQPLGVVAVGHPASSQRPGRSAGRKRAVARAVTFHDDWSSDR